MVKFNKEESCQLQLPNVKFKMFEPSPSMDIGFEKSQFPQGKFIL